MHGSAYTSQLVPQLLQVIRVKFSLRDSPVASIDTPSVSTALVAFPPLIPRFSLVALVVTLPRTSQCGQMIAPSAAAFAATRLCGPPFLRSTNTAAAIAAKIKIVMIVPPAEDPPELLARIVVKV
ncbi:MAG TPA: hypothetical protein VHV76_06635 [Mycobacteriales bacterium]|jgi:hypothetical protein|nr:hypothetical protein [Mycobacteriales bacterium]